MSLTEPDGLDRVRTFHLTRRDLGLTGHINHFLRLLDMNVGLLSHLLLPRGGDLLLCKALFTHLLHHGIRLLVRSELLTRLLVQVYVVFVNCLSAFFVLQNGCFNLFLHNNAVVLDEFLCEDGIL